MIQRVYGLDGRKMKVHFILRNISAGKDIDLVGWERFDPTGAFHKGGLSLFTKEMLANVSTLIAEIRDYLNKQSSD